MGVHNSYNSNAWTARFVSGGGARVDQLAKNLGQKPSKTVFKQVVSGVYDEIEDAQFTPSKEPGLSKKVQAVIEENERKQKTKAQNNYTKNLYVAHNPGIKYGARKSSIGDKLVNYFAFDPDEMKQSVQRQSDDRPAAIKDLHAARQLVRSERISSPGRLPGVLSNEIHPSA